MSEQASSVAREAKGTHQSLKEALKSSEPWDREVDFQRRNLRRQYLRLLLLYPYARESRDVENHLWMQTSYTFIATYKQRIAALDRTINGAPRTHPQHQQGNHGPVEYRKLLQRFRQFLAEEDKFWTLLVVRFRRSFALDEAQPALAALGILNNAATHDSSGNDNADAAEARGIGATHGNGHGRGQLLFPSVDETVSVIPRTPAERESRLAILSKTLVCLGDIARYRELYNESGGRPKAGHEESAPIRKIVKGKRSGVQHEVYGRARNYDRAQLCYEQARMLVPREGNASHQLAILASYKKDAFGSLVHYYRALCVHQPYDTASENLGTVLSKALEQWRAKARKEKGVPKEVEGGGTTPLVPRLRVEAFKEKVVVLHALWRLGVEKMDAISPRHAQDVRQDFFALVSERGLPPDMISKAVILSQGALWKHRMIRESATSGPPKDHDSPLPGAASAEAIEARMLSHVLALHETLLQIGVVELAEAPPEDAAEGDLAQQITAPFRRTLPALRIASKWLRANVKYVMQSHELDAGAVTDSTAHKGKESYMEELAACVSQFWTAYTQFSTSLWRMFPPDRLPVLNAPLEEDVDMRGFLPLRQMMGDIKGSEDLLDSRGDILNRAIPVEDQVHPNEEQLMRIADLLDDAKTLAKVENSLVIFSRNEFVLSGTLLGGGDLGGFHNHLLPTIRDDQFEIRNTQERDEDAMTETTSRTDDDPVGDAFRQVLDADLEEDDGDEIVWNPRPPLSPVGTVIPSGLPSPPLHTSPITSMKPALNPIGSITRSPTLPKGPSPFASPTTTSTGTTAQDLLNNVMGMPRTSGGGDLYRSHHSESSAPQPQLLFGSGPPNRLDHSIWSTSLDDHSLKFAGAGPHSVHSHHSPPQHLPGKSSQDFSQSIWSPLHPNANQNTQSHLLGALPSAPFMLPPQGMVNNRLHQRTPSSPISGAQLFANQNRSPDDPFFYPPIQAQQPVPPVGAHQFQTPLEAYPGTIVDAGIRYGIDPLQDYRSSHNHQPGVQTFTTGPPLPSVWGNT